MNELVPRPSTEDDIRRLEQHFDTFLDAKRYAEATAKAYRLGLRRLITWMRSQGESFEGDTGLVFRNHLEDSGLSPRTVNLNLGGLRTYFSYLVARAVVQTNPFIGPRVKVEKMGRRRVLEKHERAKLMAACRGSRPIDLRDRAMFRVMLTTGLRVSSVCALDSNDVQHEGESWILRVKHKGRKGKDDFELLGTKTLNAIVAYRECLKGLGVEGGALFRSHPGTGRVGGRLGRSSVDYAFKGRVRAADINDEGLSLHSLRRTAATRALELGKSYEEVAQMAGHASTSTTKLYDQRRRRMENAPELLLDKDLEE